MAKKDFDKELVTLTQEISATKITSRPSYDKMVEHGQTAKAFLKEIDETFDPIIKKAHAAHKEAVAQKKTKAKPFQDIMDLARSECRRWLQIEKDRQRKAEEKLRAKEQAAREAGKEVVAAPPVENYAKKNEDIVYAKVWKMEVTDPMAIIKAVAAGKLDIDAVKINETFFRSMATSMKSKAKAPGVRFWEEDQVRI